MVHLVVEDAKIEPSVPKKLLYMDILNYTTRFIPLRDWSCTRALARMSNFVQAARTSGWHLRAFLDETASSDEANEKWRLRREKEVRSGERSVPQGANVLIGDMLRKCGVEIAYSLEADNDDTLAFYAHADGASILSADKDMFRYVGATYTVYSDFEITREGLKLTKHRLHDQDCKISRYGAPTQRPLGPPPAVQTAMNHVQGGVYLRGAPSPLVRELGFNPHGTVAPLRHTMYSVLKYSGPITEKWPEWDMDTNTVKWAVHAEVLPPVEPNPQLLHLLNNPDEAVASFFPTEANAPNNPPRQSITKDDWHKHVFSVRSVIYELAVMSNRAGPSLLDLWLQFESRGGSGGGGGRGGTKRSRLQNTKLP
jgi:hypothetical protein